MSETAHKKSGWLAAGRSIRGSSHIRNDLPCQDFLGYSESDTGRRVVGLADGAGSARHSAIGARAAVDSAIRFLLDRDCDLASMSESDGLALGRTVVAHVKNLANELNLPFSEFSCTLLIAAMEGDVCYTWQLGDGAWIVQGPEGIVCATWPYKGDFNNETVFITSDDWESKWTHAVTRDCTAAIGFTDGFELFSLDFAHRSPHVPFVQKILSALDKSADESSITARIEQMLLSPLITEREDDDITVALIWKDNACR